MNVTLSSDWRKGARKCRASDFSCRQKPRACKQCTWHEHLYLYENNFPHVFFGCAVASALDRELPLHSACHRYEKNLNFINALLKAYPDSTAIKSVVGKVSSDLNTLMEDCEGNLRLSHYIACEMHASVDVISLLPDNPRLPKRGCLPLYGIRRSVHLHRL